jgi:WD40 repeat protein/predicted ATP-binding protein involved in virulence
MAEAVKDSIPPQLKFRFSLEEHVGTVILPAWSPNGRILASGSADKSVNLWNPADGRLIRKLKNHSDAVVCLAWSPDGNLIASGSYDDSIVIWDESNQKKIKTLRPRDGHVTNLAWSPSGHQLAAGFETGVINIYETNTYGEIVKFEESINEISSILWTNTGQLLSLSYGGEIRIWNTKTWRLSRVVGLDSHVAHSLDLSPDGKILAAGSEVGTITIWRMDSWEKAFEMQGHERDVTSVKFSPDSKSLASKSFDGSVRLWNMSNRRTICKLHEPSQDYWLSRLAFHPSRPTLATLGASDTIIRIWDLELDASKISEKSQKSKSSSRKETRPTPVSIVSPPEELVDACLEGQCVVYVGAGLASQSGLPMWNEFVQDLVEWGVKNNATDKSMAESLREALATGNAAQVADIIVGEINQNPEQYKLLIDYIRKTFTSKNITIPITYSSLKQIPFFAALTTNFDNLLERTYKEEKIESFTPNDTDQLLAKRQLAQFFILKLYGTVERPETIMLSPAQYESNVSENILFSQFMETLFVSNTLFFIGASLEGIEVYLNALKISSGHLIRRHYAFVSVAGSAWRVKADILKRRYGINIIPFTASPGFPEVKEFLDALRLAIFRKRGFLDEPSKTSTGRSGRLSSEPAPVLKRIELKNIGPFENLSLRFDKNWNVLLGDNGVGKSTILKAIATAFVGEDSRPFADRIVKTGTSNASITMEFEDDEGRIKYITSISQTDSGAMVKSVPATPIRVKKGLMLGFPALRTISWDRSSESSLVGKERPVSDDLLPLIVGEPDPRLDSLRSWLIQLDHIIESPESTPILKNRYISLRDRFFEVIEKLTPGLKIKYHKVDAGSKKVLIETDDGIVPIESVSQGTTSLLGWIGVVLQRYFDIYGHLENTDKTDNTFKNYALVLIDEIDAHMHPLWQQLIIPTLRDVFPKLQFIATTHSPLIVAGMPPNQLFRFIRDEKGAVVQVKVSQKMSDGRADQILTNDLFGLESSINLDMQKKIEEFTDLSVRTDLEKKDEKKLAELGKELSRRVPTSAEREEARKAYDILSDSLMDKIGKMSAAKRKNMIKEVKAKLLQVKIKPKVPENTPKYSAIPLRVVATRPKIATTKPGSNTPQLRVAATKPRPTATKANVRQTKPKASPTKSKR